MSLVAARSKTYETWNGATTTTTTTTTVCQWDAATVAIELQQPRRTLALLAYLGKERILIAKKARADNETGVEAIDGDILAVRDQPSLQFTGKEDIAELTRKS
jgi:hypothetical protein